MPVAHKGAIAHSRSRLGHTSPPKAPVPKVTYATVGGALGLLVIALLRYGWKIELSPEEGSALSTVLAFVLGYASPPSGFLHNDIA